MPCGSMLNREASKGPVTTKQAASIAHAQRDSPAGRQRRTPSIATPATAGSQSHERAMVVRHAAMLVVHGTSTPVGRKLVAPPYSRRRIVSSRSDGVVTLPHEAGPSATN